MNQPYVFDEFFASGKEESLSPFLSVKSRAWGKNLSLKTTLLAALMLAVSFILFFIHQDASYLCLAAVYFLVGTPALLNTLEDLKNMEINIDVLMTLAALLSILIGSGLEGALLLVLFEFSGAVEEMVTHKTKGALLSLQQLSPKTAFLLEPSGTLLECSIHDIEIGASILIRAGDIVPLDGEVIAGSSFVKLDHLTGEGTPLAKRVGDHLQAGSYNLDGSLTVKVDRKSSDSTLNKMVALITKAQAAKPKLQRFFDRFGKIYSITIIALSFFFALILPWIFSLPYLGVEGSVYRALTFLIAASPCALIIATPTAYLSAISSCARRGILLKGGAILDALASCSTIAFDKTGTLTSSKLSCTKIEPIYQTKFSEEIALSIAAGLEKHTVHPIAEAISKFATQKQLSPWEINSFKNLPGYGLEGIVSIENQTYPAFIGHPDLIKEHLPKQLWPEHLWKEFLEKNQTQQTLLLIGDSLYLFHFEDEIREESKKVLPLLANRLDVVILTGDHTHNAQVVGKALNISSIYPNLKPEDKLRKVEELSQKQGLIMVGDGINDAPALARATVGISMGKIGSATAVNVSDVVFLQDDLSLLDWLLKKAHHTLSIVKQNVGLALVVIVFATTPALLGYIPLWLAVILHEGGTVIVGLNSLRLLK